MFPEGRILDFIIVGAIALIVVGPKDLPILMRKVGQFLAKMRAMAAEFRASFDELARQSELDELRREVEAMKAGRPLEAAITGHGAEVQTVLDDIHAGLRGDGAQLHPPMAHQSPPSFAAAQEALPSFSEPTEQGQAAIVAAKPKARRKPRPATSSGRGDSRAPTKAETKS
ncbi:MAG TPA: Sec-independent protein translocase protein TatB [Caulobacteraceae bacterium]